MSGKRQLEMHVEMSSVAGSGQTLRVDLPNNWDQMTEGERDVWADANYENFVDNEVSGGWVIVDD